MTGGLIQMVASTGVEDLFLTHNPQITFFKIIYRRHTNFSSEEIQQSFNSEPDFGKRSTCVISNEGDLINRMTLKITLPDIAFSNNDNNLIKFAWVRKIGYALIKSIEIEINGKVIDRHYGEWLYIWNELTNKNINDQGMKKLIGDVDELTTFTSTKDKYILYIPLQFWFCRSTGVSLPVVALQLSTIKVNLELYDLDKCYIINPTHYIKCNNDIVNFKPYEYLYQKGLDNIERYGIFSSYDVINKRLYYTSISDRFIGVPYDGDITSLSDVSRSTLLNTPKSDKYLITGMSSCFTIKPELAVNTYTNYWKFSKTIKLLDCVILANYIYLDNDERMSIAQNKQDYVIEQLYFTPNVSVEGNHTKVKFDADQPCKLMVWLSQLDYIYDFNDRFNYTDSHILKRDYDKYNDPTLIKKYDNIIVNQEIGESLIDESTILLNSQTRISMRENYYYENLQPYQTFENKITGCSIYSFALNPSDYAPSGTTNMSQFDLINLNLKMNYRVNINQTAKIRCYALCYNILIVDNGLCSPLFIR